MKDGYTVYFALADENCNKTAEIMIPSEDMPFLPRKDDWVWLPETGENMLLEKVKECWRTQKCGKYCPYIYGLAKTEEDISVSDYCHVNGIVFDIRKKMIRIDLDDG